MVPPVDALIVWSMPAEDLSPNSDARHATLARLCEEQHEIARVVEALETVTTQITEADARPDFALLALMIDYLDAVQDNCITQKKTGISSPRYAPAARAPVLSSSGWNTIANAHRNSCSARRSPDV
jgi:hypothetical protein